MKGVSLYFPMKEPLQSEALAMTTESSWGGGRRWEWWGGEQLQFLQFQGLHPAETQTLRALGGGQGTTMT